jgi:L-lactate dehydrogenase (cytochrome)
VRPITHIEELRVLAQRKLPRAVFDFIDRGSYDEVTMKANRADLADIRFRQRVMVDVSESSLSTNILGERASLPIALAPTGLAGLLYRDGEIAAARAAEASGVPYCLSTMSICSIEDVQSATRKPFWFQVYLMKDRNFSRSLIERAKTAGCSALMLTVDLPVRAQQHLDIKNGLGVPPRLTLRNAVDIVTKPMWLLRVLLGKRKTFGNLTGQLSDARNIRAYAQWVAGQFDSSISWRDVAWVRELWPDKLILKGILDPEDAKVAVDNGADAIVVSNHGGRQLDGAMSSIAALPAIVEAVGGRAEVMFDGGIRSGQDVLKALALGATSCLIGRAFLYGLGAMGESGVRIALEIIRKELEVTMALTGLRDVRKASCAVLAEVQQSATSSSRLTGVAA